MSVSSLFSTVPSASDPLSSLFAPAATSSTDAASAPASPATATSVSGGAKLLKELQDLQKSDPAEFKKVTADIAAKLKAAGQQVGGSEGQALTSLAAKFQQASQTGSLAPLKSGHHHHHGGAQPAAATTDSLASALTSSTTASSTTASSPAASPATSAAIAAYQQSTAQGSSLSLASGIIGQVLTQDLGRAA